MDALHHQEHIEMVKIGRLLELAFGLHHKLKMVPGIIRASGESVEDVSEMCREYGMRIAKEILSK